MINNDKQFAQLQRLAKEFNLDLGIGEWMGYHTLVLEKGAFGVSSHSDDCKLTFHFTADGEFVDALLTCEQCSMAKEGAP